jgi:hypothetical protein
MARLVVDNGLLNRGAVTMSANLRRKNAMIHRVFLVTAVVWAVSFVAAPIMAQQAVEGAGKIVRAPVEIPKGTVNGAEQDAPVAGAAVGTVKGTGKAVRKTVDGAGDVVEGTGKVVGKTLRGLSGN